MTPDVLVSTLEAAASETTRTAPPSPTERERVLAATAEIVRWCTGHPDALGLCRECGTRLGGNGKGHPLDPGCLAAPVTIVVRWMRRARWHARRLSHG